jgi:hypothetical protein
MRQEIYDKLDEERLRLLVYQVSTILTNAGDSWRMLTYADVCWLMLTCAEVC